MEEFVLLNYNSNEYVLIDSYMYEGKEIFHFASVYDHLLCEKNNNSFSPITDETLIWAWQIMLLQIVN